MIAGVVLVSSCSDKGTSSPYDEVLSHPPYSSLTDSVKREPKNDALYFRRAVLLNKNNLPGPALADFEKAWSLKKDERYAFGISTIWLDKSPDSAITFLNKALRELPQSILLRINLARAFDGQNNTDAAMKVCEEVLATDPTRTDVLKMMSDLLDKKGQTQASIAALEKAYAITPFDVELNYGLAFKYAENKDPKVITLCDSLAKKDSAGTHAEPYYYKGIYYANTNEKAKAIASFDEAIHHDYYFKNAYIEKGRVLYDQGKMPDAYKVFNLVLTLSPSFPDAYFWMGKCQEAMGQKDEARLNYQRAYGLDKSFTEAKEAADRLGK